MPAPVYQCNATVTFDLSGTTLDSVTGAHLPGHTNTDVLALYTSNQGLTFLPQGIVSFFPNLIVLVLEPENLQTISDTDLQPFPGLLVLGLYGNRIASLDSTLFQYTPLLQYINFNANEISVVGANLVGSLTSFDSTLQYLRFLQNICINYDANTVERVVFLNEQLPILCPDIVEACPAACMAQIDAQAAQIAIIESDVASIQVYLGMLPSLPSKSKAAKFVSLSTLQM